MISVYAIKSVVAEYIYVGMTNNLKRRLHEHNAGQNQSTKAYRPFSIIFVEEFENRGAARRKEKYLKSGIGNEY
jgi:putative endonuclease